MPRYFEPRPRAVESFDVSNDEGVYNKLLVLGSPETLNTVRPQLAEKLGIDAALTQAMPHILEVLPRGCSKGRGVEELLMHLEIDEEGCIAFGDAENDIEMLQFVGKGYSMANALSSVTEAADAR